MRNILECNKVDLPNSRYTSDIQWKEYDNELYEVVIGVDTGLSYNYDYAIDYLEIAFIGQCYSEVGSILKHEETRRGDDICIVLLIRSSEQNVIEGLTTSLRRHFAICPYAFKCDECDECKESSCQGDNEYSDEICEQIANFQEAIDSFEIRPALPTYCDRYFGNYLASDRHDEYYDTDISENPEWAYTTWKSAWSTVLGFDLYVSDKFWLLSPDVDLAKATEFASDYNLTDLVFVVPKYVLMTQKNYYIVTDDDVIRLPIHGHYDAAQVARNVFPFNDIRENAEHYWGISGTFSIASDLSIVAFKDDTFKYITFRDYFEVLTRKQIDSMADGFRDMLTDLLSKGTGSAKLNCDWKCFDDEKFEMLCYDLVLQDRRFVPDKTKKMGKTRSRDGGRDIVTESASHAGQKHRSSNKWIIQCKFSKKLKTLGRNAIQLSQLIDEYLPEGVIIATNTLIDAGAYDSYEKIGQNRKVKIEFWDGLQLPRKISTNPDIHAQYWSEG